MFTKLSVSYWLNIKKQSFVAFSWKDSICHLYASKNAAKQLNVIKIRILAKLTKKYHKGKWKL